MTFRTHFRWMFAPVLCLILFASTTHGQSSDQQLPLFEAGQAQAVIVIPDHPSPPQRFAANELKRYLDHMTGGDFQITRELPRDPKQPALVLGDCAAARAVGIQADSMARDAFVIRSAPNRIFIVGKDDAKGKSAILDHLLDKDAPDDATLKDAMYMAYHPSQWDFDRGTMNGVYRFLETLGVRWFMPGPKGEVVPHRSHLTSSSLNIAEAPHYELAAIGPTRWPTKTYAGHEPYDPSEFKALGWSAAQNRLWLLRMRLPSKHIAFNHRSVRHLWEKRFGKTHPQYFALLADGRRDLAPVPGRTGHLCYTNDGMFKQTLVDIKAYFAGRSGQQAGLPVRTDRPYTNNNGWDADVSYGKTFSLLPHDSYRACYTPQCKQLNREDLSNSAKYSAPIWLFVDRVAKAIKHQYPDHYVTCLAYAAYTDIPEQLKKLPDNVIVGICPEKLVRVQNTVNPENFKQYMHLVKRWHAMNKLPVLIWSHALYRTHQPRHLGVPMILPHHLSKLFSSLAPFSKWMYMQEDTDSIMMEHLNRYVMCRLVWDPTLDVDVLLTDYYTRFYGPAAEPMGRLFADLEARCTQIASKSSGRIDIWEEGFPPEQFEQYRQWISQAKQATQKTSYHQAVILVERYLLKYMEDGYKDYDDNVKQVQKDPRANVTIRTMRSPITIDGQINDKAWKTSGLVRFVNNVDRQPTQWVTELRLLRSPTDLYFAFTCYHPNVQRSLKKKKSLGSVEVFLDSNHDHDSYNQLVVDVATGKIVGQSWYTGGGEAPRAWVSDAQIAVSHQKDASIVEIRIPRSSVPDGLKVNAAKAWGANFCRSVVDPPRPKDRFSDFSPLLTGSFHQADLFGHIFFQK